ncbi:U32 family peptidase [uncultured Faecalibaculum sp.]|uniref:peptidase U32 family protein n=3 Tax=uncultured Faecalibaculum sp. TaxID=1729681 RepID=UPI0025DD79EA|nr:U32 family peptidase [uncultured Faecalibaculum sp.]
MPEILAPAGSRDSFEAALAAGADAVYLAMPRFGARAYAANFDLNEMREVIARAHLHGMKVYVTMNTILFEDETEEAFAQAKDLYEAGADALIVQDLGLMHMLKHRLPEMEVHASTQLSVNRPGQMEQLKKLGVTRVVLARECSLKEIESCAAVQDMETEVFVHGALCISYSGQCQFSAVRHGRSGNRGQCAQACRMRYTLEKDGKALDAPGEYLLSPRDLSVLDDLDKLTDAGVDSFKIEGRMKSPLYVYEAVENARLGRHRTRKDRLALAAAFSRGFTRGCMMSAQGREFMAMEAGNHQGISIGQVTGGSRSRIRIRLTMPLHQEDGLRFVWEKGSAGGHANFIYDSRGKLVHEAAPGQEVEIPVSEYVPAGADVRLTMDAARTRFVERKVQENSRQLTVTASVFNEGAGKPLILTLTAPDGTSVTCQSEPVQPATGRGLDAARLKKQIEKSGNSWADIQAVSLQVEEGIFLPVSAVNALRRQAVTRLEEKITATRTARETDYAWKPAAAKPMDGLLVEIQRPEQRLDGPGIWMSQFPIPGTVHKAPLYEDKGEVVSHLGEGRILDGMNISNSWAIAAAQEMGYEGVVLSEELSADQIRQTLEAYEKRYGQPASAAAVVYQKRRLMLMDHCPVNTLEKDGRRQGCSLCRQHKYVLKGMDGASQRLYGDPACHMQIFDEEPQDRIRELADIPCRAIRFTTESTEEAAGILAEATAVQPLSSSGGD